MPTQTTNYGWDVPLVNNAADEDLFGDQINATINSIDSQVKVNEDAIAAINSVPIATVSPYAGLTAPTGWLLCYGQAVSRVTYADLFAVIASTYGNGDGATTFNVPDLRGRVVGGQDDMGGASANRLTGLSGGVDGDGLGNAGGLEVHTLTEAEIPPHTHTEWANGLDGTVQGANISGTNFPTTAFNTGLPTGSTGGGSSHNNIQPTLILNYIIKT